MSLEGLNAILNKEEVIFTRQAQDLLERPAEIDAVYKAHIRTYVPMHSGVSGEEQLDVEAFAKRLIRQVKERRTPRGYITADFGYGKTSTGLYVWQQATDANVVAVPPFQLNGLLDFVVAVYGWVNYTLGMSKPSLQTTAQQIYEAYGERSLSLLAARYGGDLTMIQQMYQDGIINLDLKSADIVRFFEEMTTLVLEAGFEGLLLIPDEVQQYLEPQIKIGKTDPIGPLFNIVQDIAGKQGRLNFGLLLIVPQKELGVINDQRGDLIDRMRGMTLDLKTVYDQDFPGRLWEKLAHEFDFEDHAERMVSAETLESIGQIAARSDLSNGPRTVINAFRRITKRYLDLKAPTNNPFTPINLIDDFLSGGIVFDGTKRIQEVVNRALGDEIVRDNPERISAIKLAAAFPADGVKVELQAKYGLRHAFNDLLEGAFGTLVSNVGDRSNPGTILLGLEKSQEKREWLDIVLSEFSRDYYENAALTKLRAGRAFAMLLIQKIFKSELWTIKSSLDSEHGETSGQSLLFEGAFQSFAREFPKRLVQVRIIVDDARFRAADPSADAIIDFHLRRYLEMDEQTRQAVVVSPEVDFEEHRALITINLAHRGDQVGNRALESVLSKVIPFERLSPVFLLTLYARFENLLVRGQVPKDFEPILTTQIQPALLENVLVQAMDKSISGEIDAAGARLVELLISQILVNRYGGDYYTLMVLKTGWQSPLRQYIAALRQLQSASEKQGDIDIAGTKEKIAGLFGMSNTGFDSLLSNYSKFIEVTKDFRSKPKGQVIPSGAVRFRLHPLEERIVEWLAASSNLTMRRDQEVHCIAVEEVKRRAYRMGYKEPEIDQVLEIIEAREILQLEKGGTLVEKARTTASREEVIESVEQLKTRVTDLRRAFPDASELNLFIEHTDKLVQMLPSIRRKSADKDLERMAAVARNLSKSVEDIAVNLVSRLNGQVAEMIQHTPHVESGTRESLLDEVVGPGYVVPLNEIRNALLQQFDSLIEKNERRHTRLLDIKAQLEGHEYGYETLPVIATAVREQSRQDEEDRQQLGALKSQVAHLKMWRHLATDWFDVFTRLQQLGEAGLSLSQRFQQLEQDISDDLVAHYLDALPNILTYEKRLNTIRDQTRKIEGEAQHQFHALQQGYLDLLHGVGCTTTELPIIYSPLDPDAVYARLYTSVQQAIIGRLDVLDNSLEQLLGRIKQKRVVQHDEEIESVTVELLSKAEALKGRIPYAEANALDNIRDFTGTNTGHFYLLIREIYDVQIALGDLEREVGQLDVVAEPPQLTPDEQHVLDILAGHDHTDLATLSSAPEELDRLWNVVRALWEKQRIRIMLETVEQ